MDNIAGVYNHHVLFESEGDENEVIGVKGLNYPGIPQWLINQSEKVDSDKEVTTKNSNWELKQLLSEFGEAEHDHSIANVIASRYETGNMYGGANHTEATVWYVYAAEKGSSHAALRLFYSRQDSQYLKLAFKNAITSLNEPRRSGLDVDVLLKLATEASTILLTLNLVDQRNQTMTQAIESILTHKRFKKLPQDVRELLVKQYQLHLANGSKISNHQVVKQILVDDGDFKVGIYNKLNMRLPLISINVNIESIKKTLDAEFPWFANANHEIYKQLLARVLSGAPEFKIRPLLLAGPPGTGKTTWAKRLADLCEVPFSLVMAGGSSDSMHLRGLARGWGSSRPGAVAKLIASEQIANPLFIVDEIDKVGSSNHNGSMLDVLLQLVEPATNRNYLDECLQAPCDFSWVSWIATCNQLSSLPKPLLDRFTIIHIAKPSEDHAQTIINGAIKNYAAELKIDVRMLPSIGFEQFELLQKLSPREINKVVRIIIENQLADKANVTVH